MKKMKDQILPSQQLVAYSDKLSAQEAYEKDIIESIDLNNWDDGSDFSKTYMRIEQEVHEATVDEKKAFKTFREELFPKIATSQRAIKNLTGLYKFDVKHLEEAHKKILFTGGVEACDGTNVVHDTIPITITQIGVCLTSYLGQGAHYAHRFFRRDFHMRGDDPVREAYELLEARSKREGVGIDESDSSLTRRGIMAYAERKILLEKSDALWRMGHGNPVAWELMTGFFAHHKKMADAAIDTMSKLILDHKRFVFVPSAPRQRALLSMGNALAPLEYLILFHPDKELNETVISGNARSKSGVRDELLDFVKEIENKIVVGLYKASQLSPAYMFYAHKDYAHQAALIAMADSVLLEHRGFPFLIDMADRLCASTFGAEDFSNTVQQAYASSKQPFQFLGERQTRNKK